MKRVISLSLLITLGACHLVLPHRPAEPADATVDAGARDHAAIDRAREGGLDAAPDQQPAADQQLAPDKEPPSDQKPAPDQKTGPDQKPACPADCVICTNQICSAYLSNLTVTPGAVCADLKLASAYALIDMDQCLAHPCMAKVAQKGGGPMVCVLHVGRLTLANATLVAIGSLPFAIVADDEVKIDPASTIVASAGAGQASAGGHGSCMNAAVGGGGGGYGTAGGDGGVVQAATGPAWAGGAGGQAWPTGTPPPAPLRPLVGGGHGGDGCAASGMGGSGGKGGGGGGAIQISARSRIVLEGAIRAVGMGGAGGFGGGGGGGGAGGGILLEAPKIEGAGSIVAIGGGGGGGSDSTTLAGAAGKDGAIGAVAGGSGAGAGASAGGMAASAAVPAQAGSLASMASGGGGGGMGWYVLRYLATNSPIISRHGYGSESAF